MSLRPILDRPDWPEVGDEVLYRSYQRGWVPATVLKVANPTKSNYGPGRTCPWCRPTRYR